MVPLVKPLDIIKFKSSSYQALKACFNPYKAFLRRISHCLLNVFWFSSTHVGDLWSIDIRNHVVDRRLTFVGVVGSIEDCIFVIDGMPCCLELSVGEEDLLTLEPKKQRKFRSRYHRASNLNESMISYFDNAVLFRCLRSRSLMLNSIFFEECMECLV
nr:hypothetical protein [Tanacetum cinerariifolium]